ncbi:MAG: sugar phosphate isomerase/epimerase family protein [Pirellulaceae bacterium]|nr:sugar phosphate isomerase/epimerase family protein [Pirellulaceae bacterium]
MLQIKIGIQLASLRLPFPKALLTARQLGADAVEIDARGEIRPETLSHTGVRQIRKMMDDLNLRVSAVSFRTRRGYHVLDDLDRRLEATRQAMRMAYDLGCGVVVNQLGPLPDEADSSAWETLLAALADLGRHGQKVGALLAAETGPDSGSAVAKLLSRLPTGSLGIDFNPAQLILHGHSPAAAMRELAAQVLHMHATDATRDLELRRGIETALGRGGAEFPELLAILEEQQYRGYITVERRDASDPSGEIAQAVRFLRNL